MDHIYKANEPVVNHMPYYHTAPAYVQPAVVHGVAAPAVPVGMGFLTNTSAILVLFILLVIILRATLL